jgi:uncharacterized membrane protein
MYSKVRIAGHPVHPMLVSFPVTLYVVTLISYLIFRSNGDTFWLRAGWNANVAAVVCALVAAVPGFIDWAAGIPRGTQAKTVGLWHMVSNVIALALFAWSAIVMRPELFSLVPHVARGITLSMLGVVFTLIAGYLGWSMVQTHHVGVQLTREQERLEPQPTPDTSRTLGRPLPH